MTKKIIAIATLLCALPMLAHAGTAWKLNTWVKSQGGSIQTTAPGKPVYTQTVTQGSVFKTYTSNSVSVQVTANSGYQVSAYTRDGIVTALPGMPLTVTRPVLPETQTSIWVNFARTGYTLTAAAGLGGSVVNTNGTQSFSPVYTGVQSPVKSFIFSPAAGYKLNGITGIANVTYQCVDAIQTTIPVASCIGTVNQKVKLNITNVTGSTSFTGNFQVVGANAGPNQSVRVGQLVTLDGSLSSGGSTYAWALLSGPLDPGTGTTVAVTLAATAQPTFTPTIAGNYVFRLTYGGTTALTTVYVTASDQATVKNTCVNCHTGQGIGIGIFDAWSSSVHKANAVICANCHTGADTGSHPGTINCLPCHSGDNPLPKFKASGSQCYTCHGSDLHGLRPTGLTLTGCTNCHVSGSGHSTPAQQSCIVCHAVGIKHLGTVVDDNNGVRAITGEFTKWSHHVTGVTLNDAHCAACHLEGKAQAGAIVIDTTYHMADAKTHLRDTSAGTDGDFAWDPATPNHSGMDTFCMSCHDSDGAVSAGSTAIRGVINAIPLGAGRAATATAQNPFGDTISNRYDKMQRPVVVDVSGQFALTNASHHAVKGQKYTKRTRVVNAADPRAMTAGEVAAFTANSSATLVGARSTIYDARAIKTSAGTGHNAPFNVSKFEATYTTLSGPPTATSDKTLGDDSVLHCGDCHTVGQYRLADVGVLPRNATVIGAHGSANEYMLRNTQGTDARHMGQTYTSSGGINTFVNTSQPWLVCFNCHTYQAYGSIGNATGATGTNHAAEYANSNRCNGPVNTISFVGYTTSINDTAEPYAFRLGLGQRDGIVTGSTSTSDTDFSNLFGIQCLNCHNSGPAEAFGGIHGSKLNTYTDANGNGQKPYRFLPGLGNTMFVPGSAAGIATVSNLNWEQKVVGTYYDAGKTAVIDNGGCYTIVPETGPDPYPGQPAAAEAPYSVSPAFDQEIEEPAANTKIFGTWGGCDDHRGNAHGRAFATGTIQGKNSTGGNTGWVDPVGGTYPTGGAGIVRKVLRPVSY